MRHQAKLATQCFAGRNRLVPDMRMGMPADKAALVARPHIFLALVGRRLDLEDLAVGVGVLNTFVMAAHAWILKMGDASLLPIQGSRAVGADRDCAALFL